MTGIEMHGRAQEGKMRSKLREAILAGFDPAALDETLRDNGLFRHNIAMGPAFATRVNSLIIPNWRTYDLVHRNAWRDSRASAA